MEPISKIYVEPTNRCNLACRTCIRNNWDVAMGDMTADTYDRVLGALETIRPTPTVFFGGLGEPTAHDDIDAMVGEAKARGARTELITNGTLLTEKRSKALIEAGLDLLWVSLDGATPESYADVRLGAALPQVLDNLRTFRGLRRTSHRPKPEIGIVFVAMRRNLHDLPVLLSMGRSLGATRFIVTNLLPHTPAMCAETLYERSLKDIAYLPSPWVPRLDLPRMDLDETTRNPFFQALGSGHNVTFAGGNLGAANDTCRFIQEATLTVGWDGGVSPCLPLLYDHTSYLRRRKRTVRRYIVGHLAERSVLDLWGDTHHQAFRERVREFDFSPCVFCGGCDLSEANLADCMGNEFPTCGGCLWGQGVIQCP